MIQCNFRPIDSWPGTPTPSHKRRDGAFSATWAATLRLLEKELNNLNAKDIIVNAYFQFGDIRKDGWPKSLARPSQPGVVLSFETKKGRIVMPCDAFNHWESNLRAIGLTLEHLRAVARYGVVTSEEEQYTGWLKLPAASPADELAQHAETICNYAGMNGQSRFTIFSDQKSFDSAWRAAARNWHPDKNGGRDYEFKDVIAARDAIRKVKGWV